MLSVFYGLMLTLMLPLCAHAGSSLKEQIAKLQSSIVTVKTVYTKNIRTTSGKHPVSFERNGTGTILDPSGIIVTNTHIIKKAPHIDVTLNDGTTLKARVVYTSPAYDFSLIQIKPPRKLLSITLASSSRIRSGQPVIAIGQSDNGIRKVFSGQIVNLVYKRSTQQLEFLELNLDLHHGDSGGPVLGLDGKMLGIIMAKKISTSHSSYAIASNTIRRPYAHYLQNKRAQK